MGKISRNGQEYTSSVKRERHLPCPDVRVGLEILGTVLILEQRPPMACQTVGHQTPHLWTEDEPGLKYLSFRNMSSRINQG